MGAESQQQPPIADLVLRSVAGEQRAFEELVSRYHHRLFYFIARIVHDQDLAGDVLQEVWLAVYRQLPRLRSVESFPMWLYRIARNQAYRLLRKSRGGGLQLVSLEELSAEIPEKELDLSRMDAAWINQSMARLPAIYQEILALRFMESMSYQEMAEVLGCSMGTIKSRMHAAKAALAEELRELHS